MARTSTFTADNITAVAVLAQGLCHSVTIREQGATGTQGYNVYAPLSTSPAYTHVAAESHVFMAPPANNGAEGVFADQAVVGYVKALTSSMTFSQVCQ